MTSSFTWLDTSEQHRRQMLDVISLFDERDARDEMGIGPIRDALSGQLFPGTGTVQTRARYFLFVPWIYSSLEARRTPSSEIAAKARQRELKLIDALVQAEDNAGTIGRVARAGLKRLPSNIYWLGLGQWKILKFEGSQDAYHRSLDHYYRFGTPAARNEDGELTDTPHRRNWDRVPEPPTDFPQVADFALTRDEAEYLSNRIQMAVPQSMLAVLLRGAIPRHDDGTPNFSVFPWQQEFVQTLPGTIAERLDHARLFSYAIHGSALLYNLILAEKQEHEERTENYREAVAQWSGEIGSIADDLSRWDLDRFWQIATDDGARIPAPARSFVREWLDIAVRGGRHSTVADSNGARALVANREKSLKRAQSRITNPQALNLWTGASGTRQNTYRWGNAQQILIDIMTPLEGGTGNA